MLTLGIAWTLRQTIEVLKIYHGCADTILCNNLSGEKDFNRSYGESPSRRNIKSCSQTAKGWKSATLQNNCKIQHITPMISEQYYFHQQISLFIFILLTIITINMLNTLCWILQCVTVRACRGPLFRGPKHGDQ